MKKLIFVFCFFTGPLCAQTKFVGLSPSGDSLFSKCFCIDTLKIDTMKQDQKYRPPVPIREAPENKRILILPVKKD
jgi:hypothetical protein